MRRLLVAIGAVAVLGAMAMPALAQAPDKLNVFLYVDTVNGSRPAAGTKPRPIGCTQSNNWRRGEQVVFRVWGSVADTGAILNTENVKYAYVSVPGQPNMKLNWGAHGAQTNRVWFWTSAWIVPADYPLGSLKARIVFKTEENKFGRYDYDMNIIPTAKAKAKKKR
jgi:hypothetical protein